MAGVHADTCSMDLPALQTGERAAHGVLRLSGSDGHVDHNGGNANSVMRAAWALALMLAASTALGCEVHDGSGCVTQYSAETVAPYSTDYRWLAMFRQYNLADAGENVALTARMDKLGAGNSWAGVDETHCFNPRGGCQGREVGLRMYGLGAPLWGDWRIGASIVLYGSGVANHALLIGNWLNPDATTERGITVDLRCSVACIQVAANQKICLDRDGKVCVRFNDNTRRVEFLNGERVLVAFPVD